MIREVSFLLDGRRCVISLLSPFCVSSARTHTGTHTRTHAHRQGELQLVRSGLGVRGGQIDSGRDIPHSDCVLISLCRNLKGFCAFSRFIFTVFLPERERCALFYTGTLLSFALSLSLSCQHLNVDHHHSELLAPDVCVHVRSVSSHTALSHPPTLVQAETRFR